MRSCLLRSLGLVALTFALLSETERDADACGACLNYRYVPIDAGPYDTAPWDAGPYEAGIESGSVVTDHRMALALSSDRTTLWDQIRYVGEPEGFAWVLPVRGSVEVGVADEGFMDALDQLTAPEMKSPPLPCANNEGFDAALPDSAIFDPVGTNTELAPGNGPTRGVVVDSAVAGPYEVVHIHGSDASSILAWLDARHYRVPADLDPIISSYAKDGFDFVVARLRPEVGVHAMVPIRVTFDGMYPVLPLRMVGAGVASHVGLNLFVIGDGRWRTKNFPSFTIDDADLRWDFANGSSNYAVQRDALAAKFGGRAFAIESSIEYYAHWIPKPAPSKPSKPSIDDAGAFDASLAMPTPVANMADTGVVETAPPKKQIPGSPEPPSDPGPDVRTAFGDHPSRRVTRLRADLALAHLGVDLELEADEDQRLISDRRALTKSINTPTVCPPGAGPDGYWESSPMGGTGCGCALAGDDRTLGASLLASAVAMFGAIARRRLKRGARR